jgi:hypothetical protein
MKITESYLRKIVRRTLAEMMGSTDGMTAMGTLHDNPHASPTEELTGSPAAIVNDILNAYQLGQRIDDRLLTKLQALQNKLKNTSTQSSGVAIGGLGENKKRK